ncbi:MAG: AIR synthase family protein, partial [Chloroflexi bacterium]|nr:AIR synthase family protein [Chloroflexota bacterium]
LLEKLLRKIVVTDPRVVLGPSVGEDAAVLDLGETLLVVKSDPITFATDRIGWYAVQVNANDIACTGGVPRWFLATLLVPERFTEDQAEELFTQVLDACNDIGVALVGGHSEVTQGIDRPLVAGTMLGEVARDRLVRTGGAQEGDSIVVTKGIAIEGTALLALERAEDLRKAGVSDDTITLSVELLNVMGISVLTDAQTACDTAQIHSMHDVTEGGLITGLREVAAASGLGLAIEEDSVPVLPATKEVCQAIGLDPMGLLASGALLITLPPSDVPVLLSELEKKGIDGWEIGMMLAPEEGLISIGREGEVELPQFSRDELARYFSRPLT